MSAESDRDDDDTLSIGTSASTMSPPKKSQRELMSEALDGTRDFATHVDWLNNEIERVKLHVRVAKSMRKHEEAQWCFDAQLRLEAELASVRERAMRFIESGDALMETFWDEIRDSVERGRF